MYVWRGLEISHLFVKKHGLLMWKSKKEKKISISPRYDHVGISLLAFSQCGWFGGCMCVKECYVLPNTKQATFRPLVFTAVFGLDSNVQITECCSMKST